MKTVDVKLHQWSSLRIIQHTVKERTHDRETSGCKMFIRPLIWLWTLFQSLPMMTQF